MIILGIETSCDETGAAVVEKRDNGLHIRSNIIASSLSLHAKTGGIIPETAAREQLRYILPVIEKSIEKIGWEKIDAIAVTYGPGLIGSLLVGVETAKTLAYVLKKPLIPVNHLYGHIYANFIREKSNSKNQKSKLINSNELNARRLTLDANIQFPALALVVSGGHTDLVVMQNHETLEVIGGTRDDAAGEAFDKIGRLLGLPYPAGATISKLAEKGNSRTFSLPRPMLGSNDFDFSFSGLKTAALNLVKNDTQLSRVIANEVKQSHKIALSSSIPRNDNKVINDFCSSVQWSIVDVLVKKTLKAAKHYGVKSILLGGGVAANDSLHEQMELNARRLSLDVNIFVPQKELCTDNAAMIAAAGFFAKPKPWHEITADPELYY